MQRSAATRARPRALQPADTSTLWWWALTRPRLPLAVVTWRAGSRVRVRRAAGAGVGVGVVQVACHQRSPCRQWPPAACGGVRWAATCGARAGTPRACRTPSLAAACIRRSRPWCRRPCTRGPAITAPRLLPARTAAPLRGPSPDAHHPAQRACLMRAWISQVRLMTMQAMQCAHVVGHALMICGAVRVSACRLLLCAHHAHWLPCCHPPPKPPAPAVSALTTHAGHASPTPSATSSGSISSSRRLECPPPPHSPPPPSPPRAPPQPARAAGGPAMRGNGAVSAGRAAGLC